MTWFGYKLHLIVDATYELPVAWTVTKASTADITEAEPLLEHLSLKPRNYHGQTFGRRLRSGCWCINTVPT